MTELEYRYNCSKKTKQDIKRFMNAEWSGFYFRNVTIAQETGNSEATTHQHLKELVNDGEVIKLNYFYITRKQLDSMSYQQLISIRHTLEDSRKRYRKQEHRLKELAELKREQLRNCDKQSMSNQEVDEWIKDVETKEDAARFYERKKLALDELIRRLFLYTCERQKVKSKESQKSADFLATNPTATTA